MFDIPYEQAVKRIHEASGLPIAELQSRVDAKMQQLGGMVSRDGAVHIIANELGVQLAAPVAQSGGSMKIGDLSLSARGVVVTGKVVRKYDAKTFSKNGRDGRIASLLLGDDTGVTRLVFWNEQVDVWNDLKEGDVLVVRNPFVKESMMKDRLELQLNTQSTLVVNPEGVSVADRAMPERQVIERAPRVQKYIKDLQGDEENVELVATILQVYDPRFFDSCPQCNRKLLGGNQCPQHGEVAVPGLNFSMNALLDDGTGNVRTSFWKQQALRLTGKTEAEFQRYKDDPNAFESIKNDLLGEFIKVVGRVKRNETFDRIELTANLVFTDVDPIAELQNLDKKLAAEKKPDVASEQPASAKAPDSIDVAGEEVVSLDDLESLDE